MRKRQFTVEEKIRVLWEAETGVTVAGGQLGGRLGARRLPHGACRLALCRRYSRSL